MLGRTEGEHLPDPEESSLPLLPAVMGAAALVKKEGVRISTFKMVVGDFFGETASTRTLASEA